MKDGKNITESLKKLAEIVSWFESQAEVDVEEGLLKVKDAAKLIKESKERLGEIENEFKEIEKEVRTEIPTSTPSQIPNNTPEESEDIEYPESEINPEDIPF